MKNLRSSLTAKDMEDVFHAYGQYRSLEKVGIYLSRVIDANSQTLEEVLSMVSARSREIINEAIEKNGLAEVFIEKGIERGEEKKARDAALEMIKRGFSLEDVSGIVNMPIDWVKSLLQ